MYRAHLVGLNADDAYRIRIESDHPTCKLFELAYQHFAIGKKQCILSLLRKAVTRHQLQ